MKVITGFGYIKDDKGNIVAKYELEPGDHPLREGYSFVELPNKQALDNIIVPLEPKSVDQIKEEKIENEMRAMAIERLKARGEL